MSSSVTANGLPLLLAVFLLLNPFGGCAMMAAAATQPALSTCPNHPSPNPQDCGEPVCTCLATKPAANSVLVTSDQGLALALPASRGLDAEQTRVLAADEHDAFAPRQRFLAIHQFRI